MWKKIFRDSRPSNEASENPLYKGIDRERLPIHTAIIMDGNGRWPKGADCSGRRGIRRVWTR